MTTNNLNVQHNVTLTEGQISTILYIMEGYIEGNDDYNEDSVFYQDCNSIFDELQGVVDKFYDREDIVVDTFTEQLETVVDNHYDKDDPLEITPFQEELEVKKYIRDNPITAEKVTQTQLQSIKGGLL